MNPWEKDPEIKPGPWDDDEEGGVVSRIGSAIKSAVPTLGKALDLAVPQRSIGRAIVNGLSPDSLGRAAEGITNDIGGGLQGVNPIAMQEAQPVGRMSDIPGMVSRLDGTMAPAGEFPADQFATMQRDGATYIIPREGVEESRLASAGRLLGYGAATGIPGRAMAPQPPSAAQTNALTAEAVGVTPSFAMKGPARAKIAAAGEQFFPTAGSFRDDAERVTGEIAGAATKLADRAGPGSVPVAAGEALQRGGEVFTSKVRDVQGALYGAVDKAISPATPVQAPATLAAIAREGEKLRKLPNTISADRLKALEDGTITWEQARALRTDIGTALRSFDGSETNVAKGQLSQVYKALSEDLEAAATAAGPEALQAWKRANTYTRVSEKRISEAFGKFLGDKITPEAAYDRLVAMAAADGPRANIGSLGKVFRALPKEDAAIVAGTIIRRLGRANPSVQGAADDAFSAATFLTKWNKMDPTARRIIANGGLDDGVADGLTQLAKVADRFNAAESVRNRSNTGNVATAAAGMASTAAALFSGNPLAAAGVIATGAIAHISARALTNPAMLKALNEMAATGQTTKMKALAASKSPLAIEAATILRLQSAETSQPPALPAP